MPSIVRYCSVVALTLPAIACRASEAAPAWLEARAHQEARLAAASPTLHDFRFSDQRKTRGITFKNRIVDDAGKAYKLVHHDHGSGLCAADIDGDGHPDLYFLTQLGTNQLWKNVGDGKFVDITAAAGLTMPDEIAVGCAFADIDYDGDPDLFVTTVRHGNRLFENTGHGTFRDITATAGVGYDGHSAGAVFFDYDGDGLLDLFVTNVGVFTSNTRGPGGYYVGLSDAFLGHLHPERAEASILYHNLGGNRFKDVTREVGLVDLSWSGDAAVLDVNGDGFPDLFVLDMQGADHLWINEGGKQFRESTAAYFPRTPWGAMGAKVFDANGDGRLDLFVTSMHPDMRVDLRAGDWADEARKDDPAQMPGQMIREPKSSLIFGNALFENRGDGSAVIFDLDGDGDLDIVTNEFNAAPQVLVSDLAQRHHVNFLEVRLRGTRSNKEGLGAEVTVDLPNGRRILKLLDGKSGYLSQSDLPLYFGLGDADSAAAVEVRWPSGERQTLPGPKAGQTIDVVEP